MQPASQLALLCLSRLGSGSLGAVRFFARTLAARPQAWRLSHMGPVLPPPPRLSDALVVLAPMRLKQFDRHGQSLDEVEFDTTYNALMDLGQLHRRFGCE